LLTLLCLILSHVQGKELQKRVGSDCLAGFVKVIDLTLLMESYFNMDSYSEEELWILDVFIPYYIFTFVNVVERTQGDGMKLIKVHILQHFPTFIRIYGSPKHFDTFIPESNHKSKVKVHARRTRFELDAFEWRTLKKP
jgi:hypothetical protein